MVKREDCVKIGEIGKTHNLQGALIVYTDNDLLEQYMDEPVFILLEGAPVPFYIAEDGLTERNHSSYIDELNKLGLHEQIRDDIGNNFVMQYYNELPEEAVLILKSRYKEIVVNPKYLKEIERVFQNVLP